MATPDEPFKPVPEDEVEEISPEFIVGDEEPDPFAAAQADPFAAAKPAQEPWPAPQPRREPRPQAAAPRAPAAARTAAVSAPAPAAAPTQERPPQRAGFPLAIALLFLLLGAGAGFFAGLLWERQAKGAPVAVHPSAPATPGKEEPSEAAAVAPKPAPKPAPKSAKATRPSHATKAAAGSVTPAGKGWMELTAPAAADVYLDGRRVGRGSMRIPVAAGKHRIEVRLGKSRVAETFFAEPGMTWTYEVTPTR
jgi:hypothetical protein